VSPLWKDALVRDGHAPTAKRLIAVLHVGVAAVKPLPPTPIKKHVTRKLCMKAQERSSLRGLTGKLGVSRTSVSIWIKKGDQLPS